MFAHLVLRLARRTVFGAPPEIRGTLLVHGVGELM